MTGSLLVMANVEIEAIECLQKRLVAFVPRPMNLFKGWNTSTPKPVLRFANPWWTRLTEDILRSSLWAISASYNRIMAQSCWPSTGKTLSALISRSSHATG